jgi:hypothetical protein
MDHKFDEYKQKVFQNKVVKKSFFFIYITHQLIGASSFCCYQNNIN